VTEDPDPRYALANERTFLAWIRTALGLLAAGAGVVAIDLPWPDAAVRGVAVLLAIAAGGSAVAGWNRWRQVESAISAGQPAPPLRVHVGLAVVVGFVAAVVAVLIVV
jgi:putative membrane protein